MNRQQLTRDALDEVAQDNEAAREDDHARHLEDSYGPSKYDDPWFPASEELPAAGSVLGVWWT